MRQWKWVGLGLVLAVVGWLLLRPQPVSVDLAKVQRGPMQLTVRDDGRTRIREKYIVSSPVAGRLIRVDLKPGDQVFAGETTLTVIEPSDPTLLDPRALAEARAREKAAEARLFQLEPRLRLAQERFQLAETELARLRSLRESQSVSQQELDQAALLVEAARSEQAELTYSKEIAEYELRLAQAALIHTGNEPTYPEGESFRLPITSPISGKVLRVMQESATVVTPGAPLLELGDPSDLEIEIDVLSTDAVRIRPGAKVYLEHWGGARPLLGMVRLVEPSAFTKVSALGIEEQRVNVIIDLVKEPEQSQPYEETETDKTTDQERRAEWSTASELDRATDQAGWASLGDGYRVEAAIVVWEEPEALKLPIGALFRTGDQWSVFVEESGRARLRTIRIGQRNDQEAEVLEGLQEGDSVILHPGDQISDGVGIQARRL